MKKVLIVRSVSFQLLDKLFPKIKALFNTADFSILTHPHGVAIAQATKSYEQVISYNRMQNFTFWKPIPQELHRSFDVVVVPVSNLSSGGFCNVLLFSLKIKASARYTCNSVGQLRPITTKDIVLKWLNSILFKALALLFTFIIGIPIVLLSGGFLVVNAAHRWAKSIRLNKGA